MLNIVQAVFLLYIFKKLIQRGKVQLICCRSFSICYDTSCCISFLSTQCNTAIGELRPFLVVPLKKKILKFNHSTPKSNYSNSWLAYRQLPEKELLYCFSLLKISIPILFKLGFSVY